MGLFSQKNLSQEVNKLTSGTAYWSIQQNKTCLSLSPRTGSEKPPMAESAWSQAATTAIGEAVSRSVWERKHSSIACEPPGCLHCQSGEGCIGPVAYTSLGVCEWFKYLEPLIFTDTQMWEGILCYYVKSQRFLFPTRRRPKLSQGTGA
jgi:hypothetical protein